MRDLGRKVQDAEGEAKRAKLDAAEAKRKLGDATLKLKQQEEDQATLNTVLANLTQQLVVMEADLAQSEATCDEYEALIKTLQAEPAAE